MISAASKSILGVVARSSPSMVCGRQASRGCQATPLRAFASDAPSSSPVYVVFGATGGIGSALAARLAIQPGAKLVLVARDAAKLDTLRGSLPPGADATALMADVTDAKEVEAAIAGAVTAYGRIDSVANCVGSIVLKSAHTTSDEEFDKVVRLNLNSCFYILRSAVKRMMPSGGGSVVFCSSAVARHGIPNHEAIAAAKAGVQGLALSAAATYAPKNIRVNCVAPGLTRTPLSARITGSPGALKASESMHALRRIGEADEVAAALEFLMAPSNCFITGQVLGVDGGLSSLKPQ
ncbi:hypothetical protein FOA52_015223 [Chlamydomonas sp. UWO 241]|nr:hypothetical protein FOA52_015223 [Chlamydomonas sp. UWO 241]